MGDQVKADDRWPLAGAGANPPGAIGNSGYRDPRGTAHSRAVQQRLACGRVCGTLWFRGLAALSVVLVSRLERYSPPWAGLPPPGAPPPAAAPAPPDEPPRAPAAGAPPGAAGALPVAAGAPPSPPPPPRRPPPPPPP